MRDDWRDGYDEDRGGKGGGVTNTNKKDDYRRGRSRGREYGNRNNYYHHSSDRY